PKTLKKYNIHCVSLANNHTMDYGLKGLQQTMAVLGKHQIQWFGAGLNASQASQPIYKKFAIGQKTFQLIVIAGFEHRNHYNTRYNYYATENIGGVNKWKPREAIDQLGQIRQSNAEAFIVAYPHWGKDYSFKTRKQTKLAHTLIDAGADLVIGHGAHILQEIENYHGHWILYNLGNFVFNSSGRYQKRKADPFSLTARLNISYQKNGLALELVLYPIFSDNRLSNYQPRPVTEKEMDKVQDIIFQRSPPYLRQKMRIGRDETGFFLALNVWPFDANIQNPM
nr:CapA family protein [Candidatus Poribacteria bacterium]